MDSLLAAQDKAASQLKDLEADASKMKNISRNTDSCVEQLNKDLQVLMKKQSHGEELTMTSVIDKCGDAVACRMRINSF